MGVIDDLFAKLAATEATLGTASLDERADIISDCGDIQKDIAGAIQAEEDAAAIKAVLGERQPGEGGQRLFEANIIRYKKQLESASDRLEQHQRRLDEKLR